MAIDTVLRRPRQAWCQQARGREGQAISRRFGDEAMLRLRLRLVLLRPLIEEKDGRGEERVQGVTISRVPA